jgi:basic amino acid/polyamine antiporter, APA family
MFLQALLRTKSIDQLQSEIGRAGQFRRVLGMWQLTSIGLGGLIGAGIFVLTGVSWPPHKLGRPCACRL